MVKTLNIPLEDYEYDKLRDIKGKTSWKDFVMSLAIEGNLEDSE